jgi:hypothetical protein
MDIGERATNSAGHAGPVHVVKKIFRIVAILFVVFSIGSSSGRAAEGGYSNYIPGTYGDFAAATEPPTKFTIRNDFYYYGADGDASVRSGAVEADAEFTVFMNLVTLLYKPEVEIVGAHYAFGALVPAVVYVDIDARVRVGPLEVKRNDDVVDFGDLTLIPGILFWNYENFHFTLAEFIVTPTGRYDSDDLANSGLNYWTFDTNVAATYLNEDTGQDYSINLGYNYNTKNTDTNYRTGQEFHLDYFLNQFLSESFAIGLHGFYLKQVTGDRGSGAALGDFKGEAAGVGPALLWSTRLFGRDVSFIAKWLHEFHAERRLEGDHVFASIAIGF